MCYSVFECVHVCVCVRVFSIERVSSASREIFRIYPVVCRINIRVHTVNGIVLYILCIFEYIGLSQYERARCVLLSSKRITTEKLYAAI